LEWIVGLRAFRGSKLGKEVSIRRAFEHRRQSFVSFTRSAIDLGFCGFLLAVCEPKFGNSICGLVCFIKAKMVDKLLSWIWRNQCLDDLPVSFLLFAFGIGYPTLADFA